jgi:hypothetical protein
MAARVVLIADRVAFVLGTAASILHEHRGDILAHFPRHGPKIVRAIEWVQSATAIYGFARVALELPQLIRSLRSARIAWQSEARAVEGQLSSAERQAVHSLDDGVTETLDQADAIRAARDPDAAPEGGPSASGRENRLPAEPSEPVAGATPLPPDPDVGEGLLATRVIEGHTIKVTENGLIFRCTRCDDILDLLDDYRHVFAADDTLVVRLGRVEELAEHARTARAARDPTAQGLAGEAAEEAAALLRDVRRAAGVQRDLAEEAGRAGSRPGMPPAEPVPAVPAARVREGMDSLARFRQQRGLPPAGAADDASTVARLDIGSESFYGVNAHDEAINVVANAQSRTHAEGQAFQRGAGSLEASGETRGVLYVDRELCRACGDFGAVRSMTEQLGLLHLDVYTPSGLSQRFSFSIAGR